MSIVESDGPPSWSLDARETGRDSTKCTWVGVEGLKAYSPQFRSHQETNMAARRTQRHLRSQGKIGDCEQSRKEPVPVRPLKRSAEIQPKDGSKSVFY